MGLVGRAGGLVGGDEPCAKRTLAAPGNHARIVYWGALDRKDSGSCVSCVYCLECDTIEATRTTGALARLITRKQKGGRPNV